MKKEPEEYLREPYARVLIPDEKGNFSAEILEFPGCFSQGDTANEALENLESAAIAWIESALNQGQAIPPASMNQGYGGKIALRLPRSIHRRAAELAERENTSLNQFILSAIAARVGAEDFCTLLAERLENRLIVTASSIVSCVASTIEPYIQEIRVPLIPQNIRKAETVKELVMPTEALQ